MPRIIYFIVLACDVLVGAGVVSARFKEGPDLSEQSDKHLRRRSMFITDNDIIQYLSISVLLCWVKNQQTEPTADVKA